MKPNSWMIRAILTGATLTGYSPAANAIPIAEGGYVGRLNKQTDVHMLIRAIPGRSVSFMAVLFKPNGRNQDACLYLVDPSSPAEPTSYAMNPLVVTDDGEIGMNTDIPSLEMVITDNSNPRDPTIKIVSANSKNTYCFQGSIDFASGHRFLGSVHSRFNWSRAIMPGDWKIEGYGRIAAVAPPFYSLDDSSLNSSILFESPRGGALPIPTGKYMAREKAPGFFTLKRSELSGGLQRREERIPRRIGFAARTIWGTRLFLINPADHTDVLNLRSMDE